MNGLAILLIPVMVAFSLLGVHEIMRYTDDRLGEKLKAFIGAVIYITASVACALIMVVNW